MANQNEQENMVIELLKEGYPADLISTIGIPIEIINKCKEMLIKEGETSNKKEELDKSREKDIESGKASEKDVESGKAKELENRKEISNNKIYSENKDIVNNENRFDSNVKESKLPEKRPLNNKLTKMQKMRETYYAMLQTDERKNSTPKQIQTDKEREKITKYIGLIDEKSKLNDNRTRIGYEDSLGILHYLKQLDSCKLEMEQIETVLSFIANNIESKLIDSDMNSTVKKYEKKFIKELAKRVREKAQNSDDIEELKLLSGKLTYEMSKIVIIDVETVKDEINRKISKIRAMDAERRGIEGLPEQVKNILDELAKGELDYEKAMEIINNEAANKVKNAPKNGFGRLIPTQEGEVQAIIHSITVELEKNADKYELTNPRATIEDLTKLCGNSNGLGDGPAISTVIKNLICRKDFETAKSICEERRVVNSYSYNPIPSAIREKNNYSGLNALLDYLKNTVVNAEIADMVLEYIKGGKSLQEENMFLRYLDKRLRDEGIKMSSIVLGKTKDGSRNITLQDVYNNDGSNIMHR